MTKAKYGWTHQQERARWVPIVDRGEAECHAVKCLKPSRWILPGSAWDLGHTPDGRAWTGPEHAKCNRTEGARRGNRMRRGIIEPLRRWAL